MFCLGIPLCGGEMLVIEYICSIPSYRFEEQKGLVERERDVRTRSWASVEQSLHSFLMCVTPPINRMALDDISPMFFRTN